MKTFKPSVERLEERLAPAFIASQLPALPPLTLQVEQVQRLLQRAAAATGSDDGIIAIVDRNGTILGVRMEAGVSPTITGNANIKNFAIDGAVSLARTAAFFSSNEAPLASRTVQNVSQSTMTEREVNSYTFISDQSSTVGGPGFVAPIGIMGHFPPNVPNTPQVDLFAIEHTNRDMFVAPGPTSGGVMFTPNGGNPAQQVTVQNRFNIAAFASASKALVAPLSYHDTLLPAATPGPAITVGGQDDPNVPHVASRGIGTLPGGIPIYLRGILVGGIGVFYPGKTGFASESNSLLSSNFDPNKTDRTLEAEFAAFAAVGGSTQLGFRVGALDTVKPVPGIDLPVTRIDLVGITLDVAGPGGLNGLKNLMDYVNRFFSVGTGSRNSGANQPINSTGTVTAINGKPAPDGWIVNPQAGVGITAAQVNQIIKQGINKADQTRAQLRPLETTTKMVHAVTDLNGKVVGLFRMPDAPIFSINVAVSKARNVVYYNDPTQLLAVDKLPGVAAGTAFTARTFRFLSLPFYPEGIDGRPPGIFNTLNTPGISNTTALNTAGPRTIAQMSQTILGFDSFHPNTNFHKFGANASGIVFFPGSSGVYVNGKIVGGWGVSGDGVDEDDVVTSGGIKGFDAPNDIQVDKIFFRGVRLPYFKFNRFPQG